jgi:hypothetical protein
MKIGSQLARAPCLSFLGFGLHSYLDFFTFAKIQNFHSYLLYAGPAMCYLILQSVLDAERIACRLTRLLALSGLLCLILLVQPF